MTRSDDHDLIPSAKVSHCGMPAAYPTAGLLLKLSRVGPGRSLDGRSYAARSGVGGPVGGTLSSGHKN